MKNREFEDMRRYGESLITNTRLPWVFLGTRYRKRISTFGGVGRT